MRQFSKRALSICMTLFMVLGLLSGINSHTYAQEPDTRPKSIGSGIVTAAASKDTVLAFTSDIHNSSNNIGAKRLGTWISKMKDIYGDNIECMAFGGDMGHSTISESSYWTCTQADLEELSNAGVPGVITTGNHEYSTGNMTEHDDITKTFIENEQGYEGDDYRIYCLGSAICGEFDESNNRLNNGYTSTQLATLKNYLENVDDTKVIFIITHFPLHATSNRKITLAGDMIDTLNAAANEGKKIVFLWGHNHSYAHNYESHYDEFFIPGDSLTYDATGNEKTLQFYYAAAGCMSDTEYGSGSRAVLGKGLIVTINADQKLTMTYHNESGTDVTEGGSFTEKEPVAVQSAAITGPDGKPYDSNPSVGAGSSLQLGLTTVPADASVISVAWESLDLSIASVDTKGKVKGLKEGKATIKATISDGFSPAPVTATIDITVTEAETDTYVLTNKMEAGKKYLIATGKEGSVYVLSNESGNTLKGVDATVSGGKITIPTVAAETTLFEAEGSNDNSILLKCDSEYLYVSSSKRLGMVSKNSVSSGKYWHYREKDDNGKDINLLWFYNGTDGDYGYTGTSHHKYYLTCDANGNFTDGSLESSETFVSTSKTIPKIYLYTEDDGSGETPERYTVTFHVNGHGTAPTAINDVASGSLINEPQVPSEEGWTFGGWYKEAACENAWNFATDKVTKNTDLYAKWTKAAGEETTVYDVILPSGFTGPETVKKGEDYKFTKSADADAYVYSDVTYTMDWGSPEKVNPDADGVYTIPNVTGDLLIIGSRKPKEEAQDVVIPKTTPKTNLPAPAADPSKDPAKMGKDGTPLGEGASLAAAEKAILGLPNDNDPAGTQFSKLTLRSPKQTKSSIKLSWTKPGNAKTFIVYGNNCGKTNKPKKLATVTGTSLTIKDIAGKKLGKGKYCKFIVLALDGSNMVVTTSKIIHVTTKGGKVGNDKSISVDKSVIKKAKKMKAGKSLKVKAKAVPQSKNLKVKKHVAVRYESTDTSIATVTKKGKITAKKKGTCNVYAYAQDGAFKKIKVVVK